MPTGGIENSMGAKFLRFGIWGIAQQRQQKIQFYASIRKLQSRIDLIQVFSLTNSKNRTNPICFGAIRSETSKTTVFLLLSLESFLGRSNRGGSFTEKGSDNIAEFNSAVIHLKRPFVV